MLQKVIKQFLLSLILYGWYFLHLPHFIALAGIKDSGMVTFTNEGGKSPFLFPICATINNSVTYPKHRKIQTKPKNVISFHPRLFSSPQWQMLDSDNRFHKIKKRSQKTTFPLLDSIRISSDMAVKHKNSKHCINSANITAIGLGCFRNHFKAHCEEALLPAISARTAVSFVSDCCGLPTGR